MCKGILSEIFEIADQAFDLLQKTDSKEIDPRNWNEWMKLFQADEIILELASEIKDDSTLISTEKSSHILDDAELDDYLTTCSSGQWKTNLATGVDLNQILTPQEAAVKGKAPPKGQVAPVDLTEEARQVPSQLVSNNILGDIVESIINLKLGPI